MSHGQRGHLETAPPLTAPCEGREARFLHRELNPGPLRGSPLHYHCTTPAPSTGKNNCFLFRKIRKYLHVRVAFLFEYESLDQYVHAIYKNKYSFFRISSFKNHLLINCFYHTIYCHVLPGDITSISCNVCDNLCLMQCM